MDDTQRFSHSVLARQFGVELAKVGDRCEEDCDLRITVAVQILQQVRITVVVHILQQVRKTSLAGQILQ